ncbi:hypothetical protein IWX65_000689 [Arthrobacter sp. CAN_A214]
MTRDEPVTGCGTNGDDEPDNYHRAQDSSRLANWSCTFLSIAGVLVTLGCLLAIYLESTGLGAPRDAGLRPGYTALLIAGAGAGVLVPAGACFAFLHTFHRLTVVVGALAAVVVAAAVLGMLAPDTSSHGKCDDGSCHDVRARVPTEACEAADEPEAACQGGS